MSNPTIYAPEAYKVRVAETYRFHTHQRENHENATPLFWKRFN